MIQFSTPGPLVRDVTVTGTVTGDGILTEWGLRSELENLARGEGFTLGDVVVTITERAREEMVTLTRAEYDSLRQAAGAVPASG